MKKVYIRNNEGKVVGYEYKSIKDKDIRDCINDIKNLSYREDNPYDKSDRRMVVDLEDVLRVLDTLLGGE